MTPETIIIGAGPAGATAAISLASRGHRVLMFERETGPTHKVCGEFISGPATAKLRAMGVDPAVLGGVPIRNLRLISGKRLVDAPLPFEAFGLSRFRLDTALRSRAVDAGADLRLGVQVRRMNNAEVTLGDGQVLSARRVILASGKHDLAGSRRKIRNTRGMVGFKLHLRMSAAQMRALDDCIELHFSEGGYAGLQRIEDETANLSFVMDAGAFARAGRNFQDALRAAAPPSSLLSQRLSGHDPLWDKPLAIANIPYGFRIWDTPSGPDWLWPVGDQAAVIPSFTGDGMAIALTSGTEAAQAILRGDTPQDLRKALRMQSRRQFAVSAMVSRFFGSDAGRAITMPVLTNVPRLATLCAGLTRVSARGMPT